MDLYLACFVVLLTYCKSSFKRLWFGNTLRECAIESVLLRWEVMLCLMFIGTAGSNEIHGR